MGIISAIKQILNKPFPEDEDYQAYIRNTLLISFFVAFFLYVFQPFGMSNIESGVLLICLGFGTMTFIASLAYDFVMVRLFKFKDGDQPFTFGKWILNMMGIMLTISLANFLFARSLIGYMDWSLFPQMIYGTFTIGLFPVVALGWLSLMRQEQKYQTIAADINLQVPPSPSPPSSVTEERTIFDIPLWQIRYVEALQNYVKIGYFSTSGQLQEQTERATLKFVLSETAGSSLVRCHRSFLVNREAITEVSGNAQGLVLTLEKCNKTVPVSRSYVPVFRS